MDNFFTEDGKHYIVIDNENIEVCKPLYDLYCNMEHRMKYNDKKYYSWNISLDYDTLIVAKYEYITSKIVPSALDILISDENRREFQNKLDWIDAEILELLYHGLSDDEIAKYLCIHPTSVGYHKNRIRKRLQQ